MNLEFARGAICTGLFLICIFVTGCSSSLYGWQVRTNSVPMSQSFHPADIGQHSVALFGTFTIPMLQGNEIPLSYFLSQVIQKVVPNLKIVMPHELVKRLNREGLAGDYVRMRADYG